VASSPPSFSAAPPPLLPSSHAAAAPLGWKRENPKRGARVSSAAAEGFYRALGFQGRRGSRMTGILGIRAGGAWHASGGTVRGWSRARGKGSAGAGD
jgi:hypothetical protein